MFFSEGPNNKINLVLKLTLVRCQIFLYLETKLKPILKNKYAKYYKKKFQIIVL
jgi:hypothetical protein